MPSEQIIFAKNSTFFTTVISASFEENHQNPNVLTGEGAFQGILGGEGI